MTLCTPAKPSLKHAVRILSRLDTLQEDLFRLSGLVLQLSDLPEEQLASLDIADQMEAIHCCLNRFEARCMAIKVVTGAEFYDEELESVSPVTDDWGKVRKEAKRAQKLAGQLSAALKKIHSELEECRTSAPKDVSRIHQVLDNAINGMTSDYYDVMQ